MGGNAIEKRQSGIELLRLVAMFMVLLLHANYLSFGAVSDYAVLYSPIDAFGRVFMEQLCIVSVNAYILISGWFGIRPKARSAFNLIMQVATYSLAIFLINFFVNGHALHADEVFDVIFVGKAYWFVVSYFLLYLMSPVLNAFADNASQRTFRNTLIFFFGFEFVYGWLMNQEHFSDGYSALSFAGLYLLANYIRRYVKGYEKYKSSHYFVAYILVSLLVAAWIVMQKRFMGRDLFISCIFYDCPFVVLSSLLFFLIFARMKFSNRMVNYLSKSAFAVFLIHAHPLVRPTYINIINTLYASETKFVGLGMILGFLILVFCFCILVDKLRLLIIPNERVYSLLKMCLPNKVKNNLK